MADAGITTKSSNVYNPQGNSIIERCHLTVAQILRVFLQGRAQPPQNQLEADTLVDQALASATHAMRCTSSTALLNQTPGSLAFGRDMLLDIPFAADFIALRNARQLKIDQRLLAANSSRRPKEFKVDDNVYIRHHTAQSKLDDMWEGPFKIVTVHTNGNVTVERSNGIHQRIHIRHIKP